MRTTISLDDELLAAAKCRARASGESLGQVIVAALRRELAAGDHDGTGPAIPVFRGGTGPRPGLDLSSNRDLHEALDEDVDLARRR